MTQAGKIVILHVINKMDRAGAETFIMNIMRKIDLDKFTFYFLVKTDLPGQYDQEIKSLNGKIFHIRRWNGLNTIKYKKELKKFYLSHKEIDIVHSHQGSSAYIDLKEARKVGFKTIAHSHSTFVSNFFNLKDLIFKIVSFKTRFIADYYIGCGKAALESRYGHKIAASDKSCILMNGININHFLFNENKRKNFRCEYKMKEDELALLFVGRLTDIKNPLFAIDVFEKLQNCGIKSRLFIAGTGPLSDTVSHYIKNNKIKNVVMLGNINYVDVLMCGGDVLLMPSIKEGFPVTLIEAQANGLNCLVSSNISNEVKITNKLIFKKIQGRSAVFEWVKEIKKLDDYARNVDYNNFIKFNDTESVRILTTIYSGLLK